MDNKNFTNSIWVDVYDTYLIGYINATYDNLVKVLGKPTFTYKKNSQSSYEWCIKFYNGDIFQIYDYKVSKAYKPDGIEPKDIIKWHVGGMNEDTLETLIKEFNDRQVLTIAQYTDEYKRKRAMAWWNQLPPISQRMHTDEKYEGRTPESLTGREIEAMYFN